jgi:L-ribulokinase
LSGVTFGWKLHHGPEDELFAAIEGTALHTRIILERLAEYGVPIRRVIHAGGIPRKNPVINRIYASALRAPILLPTDDTTSLGSALFAFLAAGTFLSVEEAQDALCPAYKSVEPDDRDAAIYNQLLEHFRSLYFALGQDNSAPVSLGSLLPVLEQIAQASKSPSR